MKDFLESWKNESYVKHNNQYSFEKFQGKTKKDKSTITCKDHGDFQQNFDKHLSCKVPCLLCRKQWILERNKTVKRTINRVAPYVKKGSDLKTLQKCYDKINAECYLEDDVVLDLSEQPISKANIKFYFNCRNCHKRRDMLLTSFMLFGIQKHCLSCRSGPTAKTFKEALKDIPKNFLKTHEIEEIPETPYKTKKSKVKITCVHHKDKPFIRSLEKFCAGQTCPHCKHLKNLQEGKYPGGYSDIFFENYPERKENKAYVYYFRFKGIYKIGISVNYKSRFQYLRYHFNIKEAEIVKVFETTLYNAYLIEQKILKEFDLFRVYNEKSTEIFRKDVLKNVSLESFLN